MTKERMTEPEDKSVEIVQGEKWRKQNIWDPQ